jgi:transketolase
MVKYKKMQVNKLPSQIRRDIVRMVHSVQSGHPGGSLGTVEFFTALFFEILDIQPEKFKIESTGEDTFILSNGHITPVYYSTLARRGYFDVKELATFRRLGTRLQGHPSVHDGLPGIRVASGSLGQGLSVALGIAQGKKLNNDKHLVYTLHGDGELQEGQIWEAVLYAGAKKVDNLIATIDYNNAQIDGKVDDVLSLGNLRAKFEAFNWKVVEIKNGNDLQQVISGLQSAKSLTGKEKPVAVLLHTKMGYGIDFMHDDYGWHGKPLNDEQLEKALSQLPETWGDY